MSLYENGFEIVSARRFETDVPTLYRWFAEPEKLKLWWGPEDFTSTIPVFDLRPGGEFRIIMHGPDGRDHDNHKRFVEIIENKRIVFDHLQPTHLFRMTVTFEPDGDGAQMVWHMAFAPTEQEEMLKTFLPQANEQNFDRLAARLTADGSDGKD